MTISEYVCELCEYRYEGPGGTGVLMSGEGLQTVTCAECGALHDVDLGINLRLPPAPKGTRKRDRIGEAPSMEERLAALTFACPVDPSHAARPWTDGEPRLEVPGAVIAACPRCESRMQRVRAIAEVD